MERTVTVKLQPSKEQEKLLLELAQAMAVIWNKINYERVKQFKKFGKIDFATTEKEAYHTFKGWIGGSTVQQLAKKNAEAWGASRVVQATTTKIHQGREQERVLHNST